MRKTWSYSALSSSICPPSNRHTRVGQLTRGENEELTGTFPMFIGKSEMGLAWLTAMVGITASHDLWTSDPTTHRSS